eukprot:TRINITY_DN5430_c0_g1_i1.p1 TRINITY_DN5430_c0_g1~~TRINITY_DN5430_c0_g1_i1.p1  ORF type:complete len:659 (+),score=220.80 TRINITY_DN5430_c0_g1_i1:66-1979(+)
MEALLTVAAVAEWWCLQAEPLFCTVYSSLYGEAAARVCGSAPLLGSLQLGDAVLPALFGVVHGVGVALAGAVVYGVLAAHYRAIGSPPVVNYNSVAHSVVRLVACLSGCAVSVALASLVYSPAVRQHIASLQQHALQALPAGTTVTKTTILSIAADPLATPQSLDILAAYLFSNSVAWFVLCASLTVGSVFPAVVRAWCSFVAFTLPAYAAVLLWGEASVWGVSLVTLFRVWLLLLLCPRSRNPHYADHKGFNQLQPGQYKACDWAKSTADCPTTGRRYLIVGVGFTGRVILEKLLARGERFVRCFDMAEEPLFVGDLQRKYPSATLEYVQGNVTQYDDISKACKGIETVHSTFAAIRFFERWAYQLNPSYAVNVTGSENLVQACKEHGVQRLIYIASCHVNARPSVHTTSLLESQPYITQSECTNQYGWTKALGEKAVLGAADATLKTVSLRPGGIFGHGDRTCIDIMGESAAQVLVGFARIDWVYVEDVVLALLKAEARLEDGSPGVNGEAFNVAAGKPFSFPEMIDVFQKHADAARQKGLVLTPVGLLYIIAIIVEILTWVTKGSITATLRPLKLDVLSVATINTASMNFGCSSDKARKYLNYTPCYDTECALQKCAASIQEGAESRARAAPRK